MITLDAATMFLLYTVEVLAYAAILFQLHKLDRRRLREARCTLHQWEAASPGGMVCSLCHKRVAQSLIGFPKIRIFDRDWPLF
ncbi:MAG: hypothetical protein ACE5IQ_08530 [Candidatus Methylomirabilales bacterium]